MISMECFHGLPLVHESFLVKKYCSYMTSLLYVKIYYPLHYIHYITVYKNSELIELFLFGNKGNTSFCFNSLVSVEQDMINLYSAEIFKNFPEIQKIIISASYKSYSISRSILLSEFNDHIIQLPESIDDYYLTLGKKTRQHLKNYKSKLLRTFTKVKFVTKYKGDIDEAIIEKIVQLSFDRMTAKGIAPGKTQADTKNFFQYCQSYGCVAYIEVDGVVAAGSISYMVGDRIFLYMISHDNSFSKYNLGQVCVLYAIQTAIENRMSTLHLLWGDNEYKARFAGKPNILHTYAIYRSSSLSFMVDNFKAKFNRTLNATKQSKYAKPLRNFVKNYRRKNL